MIPNLSETTARRYLQLLLLTWIGISLALLAGGELARHESTPDYLSSIRDNGSYGCEVFREHSPEVLVAGDSHSYSGWNFNLLQSELHDRPVSLCALGGFYVESLSVLLDSLEAMPHPPRTLIYGASLRQFLQGKNKGDQVQGHRNVLIPKRLAWTHKISARADALARRIGEFVHWRKAPGDLQASQLAFHRPAIEGLSETAVQAFMESRDSASKTEWKRVLSELRFEKHLPETIRALCNRITKSGLSLYVISLPESPFLERQYSPTQIAQYRELLGEFSACAKKVEYSPAESYGLGNRHFLNRELRDDFPYLALSQCPTCEVKGGSPGRLFDLDHLNLVGATRFTEQAVQRLGLAPTSPSQVR